MFGREMQERDDAFEDPPTRQQSNAVHAKVFRQGGGMIRFCFEDERAHDQIVEGD